MELPNSSLNDDKKPIIDTSERLKTMGLNYLNARQHFAIAMCRDISLLPCIVDFFQSIRYAMTLHFSKTPPQYVTTARSSEFLLTSVWCLVSGYLSYSVLDGLMMRWIVTYSTGATILRMFSMSLLFICVEKGLLASLAPNESPYFLHVWILISCILTGAFILQNFVTSNLDLQQLTLKKARSVNYYQIIVFAVVPVGLASFITMIGLLRSLLILRLDVDYLSELAVSG